MFLVMIRDIPLIGIREEGIDGKFICLRICFHPAHSPADSMKMYDFIRQDIFS